MRSAIRHRGPDDNGQIVGAGIGLGVQRLSIIDLDTGHQPMVSEDGAIWLVFNGEIYNHAELRKRLQSTGRSFRTTSDTEVVLAQYEKYGLEGINELNGMFGFAVWDGRRGALHLVRDRLGVKPLYYFSDGRRIHFASEIKALLASGLIALQVNEHAIWDYLTFRYVPAPNTVWSQIYKLPPAHTLTITSRDLRAEPKRYWEIPFIEPQASNAGDVAEFGELLKDAVRLRMLADVPVGVFLSGGLDSSTISALVDRGQFPKLKTFSVTLQDAGEDDERDFARQVSQHLDTDHREIVISDREFIDMLPDVPRQTDEPMADPTCIPVLGLARRAREEVKVVLSGEGADEVLAGYSFDYIQKTWDDMANADGVCRVAGGYPETVDQRRVSVPLHITNYLNSEEKQAVFIGRRSYEDSNEILRAAVRRVRNDHPLQQSLYLYCQNWLVEDLLMKADKMTMAASLELRTPFLDYRVVEWCGRAPPSAKVRRLADGSYETKAVLREYARRLLPEAITARPKKGFPVPVFRWLSDRLRPLANDLLSGPQAQCARWLEPKALQSAVAKGTAADAPVLDRHRLWNLMILELWAKAWLK